LGSFGSFCFSNVHSINFVNFFQCKIFNIKNEKKIGPKVFTTFQVDNPTSTISHFKS
jgi:hypothetical protein